MSKVKIDSKLTPAALAVVAYQRKQKEMQKNIDAIVKEIWDKATTGSTKYKSGRMSQEYHDFLIETGLLEELRSRGFSVSVKENQYPAGDIAYSGFSFFTLYVEWPALVTPPEDDFAPNEQEIFVVESTYNHTDIDGNVIGTCQAIPQCAFTSLQSAQEYVTKQQAIDKLDYCITNIILTNS